MNAPTSVELRYIRIQNHIYYRKSDVLDMLTEFAATEEIETRTRLEELIDNIEAGSETY